MKPYLLLCRFHELLKSAVSRAQGRCRSLPSPPTPFICHIEGIVPRIPEAKPILCASLLPARDGGNMGASCLVHCLFQHWKQRLANRRHSVSFCSYFLRPTSTGQTLPYSPYRHSNPSNIPRISLHFTEDKQTYRMLCRTMSLNWWGKKKL